MSRTQDKFCKKCRKSICSYETCSRFVEQFYDTEPLVPLRETKGKEWYKQVDKATGKTIWKRRSAPVVPVSQADFECHDDSLNTIEPLRDLELRKGIWIDKNWEGMR